MDISVRSESYGNVSLLGGSTDGLGGIAGLFPLYELVDPCLCVLKRKPDFW